MYVFNNNMDDHSLYAYLKKLYISFVAPINVYSLHCLLSNYIIGLTNTLYLLSVLSNYTIGLTKNITLIT